MFSFPTCSKLNSLRFKFFSVFVSISFSRVHLSKQYLLIVFLIICITCMFEFKIDDSTRVIPSLSDRLESQLRIIKSSVSDFP